MGLQHHYAGAIWTNHALDRMGQRGLSQELAGETFKHPDKSVPGKIEGTTEYVKRFGNSWVTLIVKQNDKGDYLVLSNWIDPPMPGTEDFKKREEWKRYKKAGFWGKFWKVILRQIGF